MDTVISAPISANDFMRAQCFEIIYLGKCILFARQREPILYSMNA